MSKPAQVSLIIDNGSVISGSTSKIRCSERLSHSEDSVQVFTCKFQSKDGSPQNFGVIKLFPISTYRKHLKWDDENNKNMELMKRTLSAYAKMGLIKKNQNGKNKNSYLENEYDFDVDDLENIIPTFKNNDGSYKKIAQCVPPIIDTGCVPCSSDYDKTHLLPLGEPYMYKQRYIIFENRGKKFEIINHEDVYKLENSLHMAGVIQRIHTNNIIHGDLKPSNFVVSKNYISIIDFDLSIIPELDIREYTKTGTIPWVSPEQCTEGKITKSTDVYVFGLILVKYLHPNPERFDEVMKTLVYSDEEPEEENSSYSEEDEHLEILNTDLPQLVRELDSAYQDIIRPCLNDDPTKRPPIYKVRESLQQCLNQKNGNTQKSPIKENTSNKNKSFSRKKEVQRKSKKSKPTQKDTKKENTSNNTEKEENSQDSSKNSNSEVLELDQVEKEIFEQKNSTSWAEEIRKEHEGQKEAEQTSVKTETIDKPNKNAPHVYINSPRSLPDTYKSDEEESIQECEDPNGLDSEED